jgi:hypothetical protein
VITALMPQAQCPPLPFADTSLHSTLATYNLATFDLTAYNLTKHNIHPERNTPDVHA